MSNAYDVIVIGSGAGGGTLVHTLAATGKRILLLERGDYVRREKENWDPRAVNLEGAMPPEARTKFEQHLVVCPGCVTYLRQARAQIGATRALGEAKPPPEEVARKLLEMFRAARGG